METVFLRSRLIFLIAVASLFLMIVLWKKFKPKHWVIEEYEYRPPPLENVPDINLGGMGRFLPHFPRGVYYFPETLIKNGSLDEWEITRKRVFDYVTLAEYQEFINRVRETRERKRFEKVDEKEPIVPSRARPLNEWTGLDWHQRPLWANAFFLFIALLGCFVFVGLVWAFLNFRY